LPRNHCPFHCLTNFGNSFLVGELTRLTSDEGVWDLLAFCMTSSWHIYICLWCQPRIRYSRHFFFLIFRQKRKQQTTTRQRATTLSLLFYMYTHGQVNTIAHFYSLHSLNSAIINRKNNCTSTQFLQQLADRRNLSD
jgi:hypothetical protein